MVKCVLCQAEVKDNGSSKKVITCGRCVQGLLTATRENKIAYRERLISEGKLEEARAVQSFISLKANGEIATFKRTLCHSSFKGVYARSKTVPVSSRLGTGGEDGKAGKE